MKKIVTLLSVPVVLLAAWGVTSWYIGQQTEASVRQFVDQQNQQFAASGVSQELVSYEKSAFGAKAVSKFKFDTPPLNEVIGEVQVINDIQNGPIFFGGGSPVQFGVSRITSHLDMDSLDEEQRQALKAAFAGQAPVSGHMVLGFSGTTAYNYHLNPLKLDEKGVVLSLDGADLSGDYSEGMKGRFTMQVGKLALNEPDSKLEMPSMTVDGNMTGMLAGQALGQFSVKAPQVSVLVAGTTVPVVFDMNLNTNSDVKDHEASGSVEFSADNIQGVDDALTRATVKLDFSGLNEEGLQKFGAVQADMQNALNQVEWNADAMETPEGQKKQQELMQKVSESGEEMVGLLFGQVLKTGKSRLHNVVKAESPKGTFNADIDLTYTGQGAPGVTELASFGPNDWAKMMQGKITLDADKAMLPAGTELMLGPLESQGLLKVDGAKIKSEAILAGDNVTLNGQQMSFADFWHLIAPDRSAAMQGSDADAANLGIPPDLMEKIQREGLTQENMQLLEESDDVPKETLEVFRQLQQMQSGLQEGQDEAKPDSKDARKEMGIMKQKDTK